MIGLFGLALVLAGWWWRAQLPTVETVRARKQTVVDLVVGSGRIQSARQTVLGVEVTGVVERVWVREGDRVAAGQRLLALEASETHKRLEAALLAVETARKELIRLRRGTQGEEIDRARFKWERAQAGRRQAEADFSRLQDLYQQQLIAKAEWERAKTALDQAAAAEKGALSTLTLLLRQPLHEDVEIQEARLKEKEANAALIRRELEKRTLTAPFPGLVIKRMVEPGQAVTPGLGLLTLADLDRLEIYVETDESNLSKLRIGQAAQVLVPSYKAQPFRARLVRIGPEVDPARGVIALRLEPVSVPDFIRPDMTVDVSIEVGRYPEVCTLPATALLQEKGNTYVWVVSGGRTKRVEVEVLTKGPEWVALAGFDPGLAVVRRGIEVKEGQKVRWRDPGGG